MIHVRTTSARCVYSSTAWHTTCFGPVWSPALLSCSCMEQVKQQQLRCPLCLTENQMVLRLSNYPSRRLTFLLSVRPSVCLSLCNVHELWVHIFSAINNYFHWSTTNFVKEKFWLGEFWLSIIASLAFSTPVFWCHDFHSRVFHSRVFSRPINSTFWVLSVITNGVFLV